MSIPYINGRNLSKTIHMKFFIHLFRNVTFSVLQAFHLKYFTAKKIIVYIAKFEDEA